MLPPHLKRQFDIPDIYCARFPELSLVMRFGGYPEGIFRENVAFHTQSCIERALRLPLEPEDMRDTILTLVIHDMTELILGDYTSPEKAADNKMADAVEAEEKEIAKRMFPAEHLHLIEMHDLAKDVIRADMNGRFNKPPVVCTPAGLFSGLIDIIDGNETFHRQYSGWLASASYDPAPANVPPEAALRYVRKMVGSALNHLGDFDLDESLLKLAKDLLLESCRMCLGYWDSVPQDRIPIVLKEELALVREEFGL